jgi:hypothetical protein
MPVTQPAVLTPDRFGGLVRRVEYLIDSFALDDLPADEVVAQLVVELSLLLSPDQGSRLRSGLAGFVPDWARPPEHSDTELVIVLAQARVEELYRRRGIEP